MRHALIKLTLAGLLSCSVFADKFTLTSSEISQGKFMSKAQEFQEFGCSGGNQSPALSWTGAPKGTEAFAVLLHDPDAPTGSGWWHWQVINIPKNISSLPAGAGNPANHALPAGSFHIKNDFGSAGFGGACPPKGHGVHRYQFTIYALSKKLDLAKDASPSLSSYMVRANALASSTIEALYKRD